MKTRKRVAEVKARYVGKPFNTRGEFGDQVDTVTLMSWGYDEERDEMCWHPSENGHAWGAWDSDIGWVIVSFHAADDPEFIRI